MSKNENENERPGCQLCAPPIAPMVLWRSPPIAGPHSERSAALSAGLTQRIPLPSESAELKRSQETMQYKVIELSRVTDEAIEETLNHWTQEGWKWVDMRFAMVEGIRRPAIAYVFFTKNTTKAEVCEL